MTLSAPQRHAMWIYTHGTPQQARHAELYLRHSTPTTRAALAHLAARVSA